MQRSIVLRAVHQYRPFVSAIRYSHTSTRDSTAGPEPAFMPQTSHSDDEERYVVTLYTDAELHRKVTALRTKYFPKHLNKLPAHLTLFHALPGSKLESHVVPTIKQLTERTATFPISAGNPFEMGHKGIGISVPKAKGGNEARSIHEALLQAWDRDGFLSEQDSRHGGVHYTIMNKVEEPAIIAKAMKELKSDWSGAEGTAVGLAVWHYTKGYWEQEQLFPFRKEE